MTRRTDAIQSYSQSAADQGYDLRELVLLTIGFTAGWDKRSTQHVQGERPSQVLEPLALHAAQRGDNLALIRTDESAVETIAAIIAPDPQDWADHLPKARAALATLIGSRTEGAEQ